MTSGELVPWRWGSLHHFDEDRSLDAFPAEMDSLNRSIDRLFADPWGGSVTPSLLLNTRSATNITPHLDVVEDDESVRITVELPGMTDEDVGVSVTDGVLTIRGEKKEDEETKGKEVCRRERTYGWFCRTIALPGDVDAGTIEAALENGVLTIELPKATKGQDRLN